MSDHDFSNSQMRPIARNLQPPPPPKFVDSALQFKSNVAQFKSARKTKISAYETGSTFFYVQLVEAEKDLRSLQDRLKRVGQLKSLNPSSISGIASACLIRNEFGVFRAEIVKSPSRNEHDYLAKLVDFGTMISVNIDNIFVIPSDFVHNFFTFALPCQLANVKKSSQVSDREIFALFKSLTHNKIVTIKSVQSNGEHDIYIKL